MYIENKDICVGYLAEYGFEWTADLYKKLDQLTIQRSKNSIGDWLLTLSDSNLNDIIIIFENFDEVKLSKEEYKTTDMILLVFSLVSMELNKEAHLSEEEINLYVNMIYIACLQERLIRQGAISVNGKRWLTKDIAKYKIHKGSLIPKWLRDIIEPQS